MTMTEMPNLAPEEVAAMAQRMEDEAKAGMGENMQQTDSSPQPGIEPPYPTNAGGDIATMAGQAPRVQGEREACSECGKMILKKNLNHHKREVHGIYLRPRKGGGKHAHKAAVPQDTTAKSEPTEKPLSVDEIVSVVVQMRWPKNMPSSKMPALLEWRAATERFLNG